MMRQYQYGESAENLGTINIHVMSKPGECTIRPYTHKELAALNGVSWLTLQRWLRPYVEEIGEKRGHFYTSRQVEIIFNRLGRPSS